MIEYTAKLYFKDKCLADVSNISYSQPWFFGYHNFLDKQLLTKLLKISQFSDSKFWTDDSLDDDEQDQKLEELQLILGITDEDLSKYLYSNRENWKIILSDNNEFLGFPRIDETTLEWR